MEPKRQWEKPVIKLFKRSTSEENVLAACKYTGQTNPTGPNCGATIGMPCADIVSS
ncbi:MAG: hypothetical protein SWH61_07500 [Thermodesulfobacteriota bacterium]|nr:hypothetical protein [Thermodesulfobacteriota bacterium]